MRPRGPGWPGSRPVTVLTAPPKPGHIDPAVTLCPSARTHTQLQTHTPIVPMRVRVGHRDQGELSFGSPGTRRCHRYGKCKQTINTNSGNPRPSPSRSLPRFRTRTRLVPWCHWPSSPCHWSISVAQLPDESGSGLHHWLPRPPASLVTLVDFEGPVSHFLSPS